MIPAKSWFPSNLQDRAAWFQNFAVQFTSLHLSLGFTVAEADAVNDDNLIMQFLAESAVAVSAFSDASRMYRMAVTEGNIGDPMPHIPAYTSPGSPTEVPAGIFERLDNLVKRIRVSPTYTEEDGALLGIIPATPSRPIPDEMQPEIKIASFPGSVVQVRFVRGAMTGVAIETKLDNSTTWNDAGRYFSSPAELVIPENAENLPRSVQVRARFVDKNDPVGQYSLVGTVATQPNA